MVDSQQAHISKVQCQIHNKHRLVKSTMSDSQQAQISKSTMSDSQQAQISKSTMLDSQQAQINKKYNVRFTTSTD